MVNIELTKYFDWISDRWYRPSTLVILLLTSLLVLFVLASNFSLSKIETLWWVVIVASLISLFIIWRVSTRIPRSPSNKVGFVIAITHEDKSKQQMLSNDFVREIQDLVQAGNLRYQFKILVLNDFHASRIHDSESAYYYLKHTRAHFLVFGKVRDRPLKNEVHHFLNLSGIVAHRPIPIAASQLIAKEFAELLPGKLDISSEGDVFAFEITAKLIDLAARYIIGIASLVSGDFQYAADLFSSSQSIAQSMAGESPALLKIRDRAPKRLFTTYSVWCASLYEIWLSTRDRTLLMQIEILIRKSLQLRPKDYPTLLLAAICYFMLHRDTKKAKNAIHECRGEKDGTWLYSLAFLHAYEGKMNSAKNLYIRAFKKDIIRQDIPLQSEQFINDVLNSEPDKVQLYYCLGLINYHAKEDFNAAARDFGEFIACCRPDRFQDAVVDSRNYLDSIPSKRRTDS